MLKNIRPAFGDDRTDLWKQLANLLTRNWKESKYALDPIERRIQHLPSTLFIEIEFAFFGSESLAVLLKRPSDRRPGAEEIERRDDLGRVDVLRHAALDCILEDGEGGCDIHQLTDFRWQNTPLTPRPHLN